ncbi:hypothetical protein CLV91_2787 [Maribacter vaceletii]|uniref:Uncharacterized protein n=1 Tax=Maribacter vaceletii TaxID=1206816 RepID=A0A495DTN8_9FLAO|nr:hypothetical protein [Maribacter vaceletii]RKR08021.1 hypothetical protein CLV91_2787 [Maribacter vaceletii]
MRNIKIITSLMFAFLVTQLSAQMTPKETMNSVTINTFNYIKDGVKRPYTVKVQASRMYNTSLKKEKDYINKSVRVSKLITVKNDFEPMHSRILSLKYNKQIIDDFELITNEHGFTITVQGNKIQYIIGKGITTIDNTNEDFFIIDEYDI